MLHRETTVPSQLASQKNFGLAIHQLMNNPLLGSGNRFPSGGTLVWAGSRHRRLGGRGVVVARARDQQPMVRERWRWTERFEGRAL